MHETVTKRIFVGGLGNDVSSEELHERFSRFGKVSNLSLKTRTDESGNKLKSFAHLDVEGDEATIQKCFNTFQNAKWKGSVLQLQYAKESFLQKLQKEIRENCIQKEVPESKTSDNSTKSQSELFEVKGPAVPGTPVPGKKDWIVGKYGRVLPVLKLKKSYKIKMMKHDPSKHCHAAKVFKDDKPNETSCDRLTWEINTPDNEITKKRKGEFPVNHPTKKVIVDIHSLPDYSKNSPQLPYTRNEEVEVVKVESRNHSMKPLLNKSNRFDSDVESDSENPSLSKNETTSPYTQTNNLSRLPKPVNKNSNVKTVSAPYNSSEINRTKLTDNKTMQSVNRNCQISELTDNKKRVENRMKPVEKLFGKDTSKSTGSIQEIKPSFEIFTATSDQTLPAKETSGFNKTEFSGFDKKIPEFKGLGMLSLLSQSASISLKKSDDVVDICFNSSADNKLIDGRSNVNTAANKRTLLQNVYSEHSPPKPDAVPGLAGLSMLSDVKKASKTIAKLKPSSSKLKEKQKNTSVNFTEKLSLVKHKESSSPILSNSLTAEKDLMNYDSSSSADTDEIIERCKKRKGLTLFPKLVTESPLNRHVVSSNKRKYPLEIGSSVGNTVKSSLLDHSFELSEYTAAISEHLGQQISGVSQDKLEASDDSYDSDLDSNDFKLVAKKLAQKAASSNSAVQKGFVNKPKQKNTSDTRQEISHTSQNSITALVTTAQVAPVISNKSFIQSKLEDTDDSSDSDLDSNDFKLVAKKLAQKAAKSSVQKGLINKLKEKNTSDTRRDISQTASQNKTALVTTSQATTQVKPINSKSSVQSKSSVNSSIVASKQAADNEKRLQAIRENMKLRQSQHSIGINTLHYLDSVQDGGTGTRVVFSSSDDDSSGGDDDDTIERRNKKSQLELFDSAAEDEDYDEMFKSKPHFEGEKGEKLMRLDQKIGDPRFKLDAKFADSDSEDHENMETANVTEVNKSLDEEKTANLKVLENVIGKTTLDRFSEKLKRNTKHIIDMNAVRFDPTKIQNKPNTEVVSVRDKKLSKNTLTSSAEKQKDTDSSKMKDKKDSRIRNEQDKKNDVNNEKNKKQNKIKKIVDGVNSDNGQNETSDSKSKIKSKLTDKQQRRSKSVTDKTDSVNSTKIQLSSSLVDMFKNKDENSLDKKETFSLLQQFDMETEIEEGESDHKDFTAPLSALFKKETEKAELIHRSKVELSSVRSQENCSSDDTSDEEETESEERVKHVEDRKLSLPVDEEDSVDESLDNNDSSHMTDVNKDDSSTELINAGRVDIRYSKDQWLKRWEDIRPALVTAYKRKHKDAMRNKRKNNEIKRKKEFLKNSKRNRWAHKRAS